jgi:hypothetical protein
LKTGKEEQSPDAVKERVAVKKCTVGRGVFARQEFAAETVIAEITGQIMGTEFESNYCMDLDGKAILEPSWPFRFLNHSCEPNCQLLLWKFQKVDGRRLQRLWLHAIRPVEVGEELTIDYAWPADAAVPCRCGAESCRGWVVDEAELSRLQRRRRPRQAVS